MLGTSARCVLRRVITITLRAPHGGRLRSARVTYAGRRAHVARTRSGHTLRETRTYRTCISKRPH